MLRKRRLWGPQPRTGIPASPPCHLCDPEQVTQSLCAGSVKWGWSQNLLHRVKNISKRKLQ